MWVLSWLLARERWPLQARVEVMVADTTRARVCFVKVYQERKKERKEGGRRGRCNDPNEKDLCRHCETISFCRLC